MEAIDSHFENMNPRFGVVSINIIELIDQPKQSKGSQLAAAINETYGFGEI